MKHTAFLLVGAFAAAAAAGATVVPKGGKGEQIALTRYANCVVNNRTSMARQVVLEGWPGERLVASDILRNPNCVEPGRRLGFAADVVRSAMAQSLIRRDLTSADADRVPQAPPLTYDLPFPVRTHDDKGRPVSAASLDRQRKAVANKTAFVAIQQFGECVARANPRAVPALAAAEPASDAELAALRSFEPQLGPCLPRGVRLELDKARLRSTITLAYYRLAMAARGSQGTVR